MNISIVAEELGIKEYPQNFDTFCKTATPVSICDIHNIDFLEKKYRLLGKYLAPVLKCIKIVEQNKALLTWGNYAAAYIAEESIDNARKITVPFPDEDTVLRFYPLLVLCAAFPSGIKKYLDRGFTEDEIYKILTPTVSDRIAKSESDSQKQGLDQSGFNWLKLYAAAGIFACGIFNITPKYYAEENVILKNKKNGQIIPLLCGTFHHTGVPLGCEGLLNDENSFTTVFEETVDAYSGYPAINSRATREKQTYNKNDWDVLLRKGDGFAGVHIPRGADLTPEKINKSFKLALEMTKKHYPEYNAKAVCCASWMLDPRLEELLGENSKITGFIRCFTKYPIKSGGHNIFGFVFPKTYESYETLPEDTSLQRKLKKLYVGGEFIYSYSGIVNLE